MAAVGRNDPCLCGSGRKTKRCCGVHRGPSEAQLARSFLSLESRLAALDLVGLDQRALTRLCDDLFDLPNEDLSLLVPLSDLLTPDIERLLEAFSDDDPDGTEAALVPVLRCYDTPIVRAGLVRNVISLRDRGRIPERLAAMAVLDLSSESTAFLRASLVARIGVMAGVTTTPGGLLLASG